jgi:predicted ATPase
MKYKDLIQFEPIESVIQLREADEVDDARRLVETFVISDRMAELLTQIVFRQLQFDAPADNKGLLIVGNYGTGKSHLMALISAIAEHADLAAVVTNPAVATEADRIAGCFEVVRAEIGSTTMMLRDIICHSLEEKLDELGVDYQFPEAGEVTNNKDSFVEMMAAFEEACPKQGLLLVLDELLDFLRTRKQQELILDLNFLREIGEVCRSTRFRFISGLQESLFDNPQFQFVAETLRRVQDRFEQVRIARDDVAYVVAQRLLKKTPEQQGKIREHLEQFAPLYGSMNEQMDKFVELFPVHPAYLSTFEKVYVAEKREVLKTLSAAIRNVIEQDVPADEPGLVAYDSYWAQLSSNPSLRSIPELKEVMDKSKVLEDRIQHAYTQPQYKGVALRIIHALSVHRLTTGDIFTPLGATAEELRDDLCLILPVPEKEADFLKTLVEKVLAEILRTVSGQFITVNKENSQYYLDLKKDIDFDSLITQKTDTLSAEQLDRYYFIVLTRVMEAADETYVSGYKIWEHEIEWSERKAERNGYLFFGAPNERSTAQPPRDFYLYFLQPNDPTYFKDEKKPDEVFFALKHRDETFDDSLKLYAAATEQANTASGENKRIYEQKAGDHLRNLTKWLREHMTTAFDVTYEGRTSSLQEVIQGKVPGGLSGASVRDLVNIAGSVCLAPHFVNASPDYPIFSVLVTRKNREQAAQEAIKWITGGVKSKQGTAVLDALNLLDGEQLRPRDSRYGTHVLDLLGQKKKGQVLNRSELVADEDGVDYWSRFRLEPEFLAVVLAALVHSGDLVLSIPGAKLGASAIDQLGRTPVSDLANFKHVEQPKGLPLGPLKELFDLLGLAQGKLVSESTRDQAVQDLQVQVAARVNKLVLAQSKLQEGLTFWGRQLLSDQETSEWSTKLGGAKDFLESLQAFNTAGKLNNFPHDTTTVTAQKPGLDLIAEVDALLELIAQVGPQTAYLATAEAVLPADHEWVQQVKAAKTDLLTKVTSPSQRADSSFQRHLAQTLSTLKSSYQDAYLDLHRRAHLGPKDDARKAALTNDIRLKQLQKINRVEIMPHQQINSFQDTLFGLPTCFTLSRQDLEATPVCPETQYRPVEKPPGAQSAAEILSGLDERLDRLVNDWTKTLLSNLDDPTVAANIDLIGDAVGKAELETFLKDKELPDEVSPAFEKVLQEVMTGLEKVAVTQEDLHGALVQGGIPCTVEELQGRFESYVADLTRGKNASKVRVVVE